MKRICSYCGKIVDGADHNCPNKPKDKRKKDINSGTGSSEWRKVRENVKHRDIKCLYCWMRDRYSPIECVHHIVPREVNGDTDSVFNENNCIGLCRNCHAEVHRTKDSWKDYVDLFKELINND